MRILCIADIHGSRDAVEDVVALAESKGFTKVLVLGDFPGHSMFRDTKRALEEARFVLDALSGFEVLAIPGNCDPPEVLDVFDEYSVNLHEKVIPVGNTSLVGLGGSSPTPFDTPFEMGEDVIKEKLFSLLSGITTEHVVLAVHNPPADTNCDARSDGSHVGSSAVREAAERFQPDVLLCSHIHESAGATDSIGTTKVANIGPLGRRRIGVIDIGSEVRVGVGGF